MGDQLQVENWVTVKDVQAYLGVGRETILQWISKRNMPAYKVGRMWKFKLSEVDEWIRSGELRMTMLRVKMNRIENESEVSDSISRRMKI